MDLCLKLSTLQSRVRDVGGRVSAINHPPDLAAIFTIDLVDEHLMIKALAIAGANLADYCFY